MFLDVYKGKKVFITGHSGFKGSWLTFMLQNAGADVLGYSLAPNTEPNLFSILGLKHSCNSIFADILNSDYLTSVVKNFQPDFIFHLAAQPLVRRSYFLPKETYEVNAIGTVNILEAAKEVKDGCVVVNVTTDKCYKNNEWEYGYRENEAMGGDDPYSSSKACSEIITDAYRNSFFHDDKTLIATARAGNVIGGGDWAEDRLVPDCVRRLNANQTPQIRYPHAIRPFQHVFEPLTGYMMLASKLHAEGRDYEGAWNFGPLDGDTMTVGEVVHKIIKYYTGREFEFEKQETNLHENSFLKLDTSKAQMKLGFKPAFSTDIALEKTVEWYKAFYSKAVDMREFSLYQMNDYLTRFKESLIRG